MNQRLSYFIFAAQAIAFLVQATTGLFIWLTLNGHIRLNIRPWLNVHSVAGPVLVLLIVVHLAINWKWVVNTTKRMLSGKPAA